MFVFNCGIFAVNFVMKQLCDPGDFFLRVGCSAGVHVDIPLEHFSAGFEVIDMEPDGVVEQSG